MARGIIPALAAVLLLGQSAGLQAEDGVDMDARLARVERLVNSQGLLDLLGQVDRMQAEMRRLRGELDRLAYELEQERVRNRQLYTDLDDRLRARAPGPAALAGGVQQPAPVAGQTGNGPVTQPPASGLPAPAAPLPLPPAGSAVPVVDRETPAPVGLPPVEPALPSEGTLAGPGALPAPGPGGAGASTAPGQAAVEESVVVAALPAGPAADAPGAGLEPPPGGASQPGVADPAGVPADAAGALPGAPGLNVALAAPPLPVDADPKAAYYQAFNLLKAGRYDDAVAQFRGFLSIHPDSSFSDSAQYWLGEAFYVQGRYEPAIVEYQRLLTRYPQSQKLTNAMLKIGYAYHKLGEPAAATSELQALIANYPDSTPARLAEEQLKRIEVESAP